MSIVHTRRRILGSLVATAPLAVLLGTRSATAATAAVELVHWGCAVRFDSTAVGPTVLTDGGHSPVGMTTALVTAAGDLEVRFERPLTTVVTAFAQPDEQMVGRAVTIGPSVGLDRVVLRFAVSGRQASARDARLYGRNVNLFVGVIGWAATV